LLDSAALLDAGELVKDTAFVCVLPGEVTLMLVAGEVLLDVLDGDPPWLIEKVISVHLEAAPSDDTNQSRETYQNKAILMNVL
jgi:hypothetical protein